MADTLLDLPLFEPEHRAFAARVGAFAARALEPRAAEADRGDAVRAGREFLALLAAEGLLRLFVPPAFGGDAGGGLRSICLAREAIAAASALADAVFAVQGLGSFPIALAGTDELRRRYLPRVADGTLITAFALTEPEAGSDTAAIQTVARRDGDRYVLTGEKTLISNAGIADVYVMFAKTDRAAGAKGLTAFVVDAAMPGFRVSRRIDLMAPHPIGDLVLEDCRVPAANRLGDEGGGLRLALATLDFFRSTVGAAACGLAARALREARTRVLGRTQFGSPLAAFQATRFALADMATDLDAARLLVFRAAWLKDQGAERVTREASMAKLFATEAAQRIVDRALQLHGGLGVQRGVTVERLYREVRALRIYEGTSEIQHLVIADQLLERHGSPSTSGPAAS